MALEPVVRRALAVLLEHAGLANGLAVIEGALEEDVPQAFQQRAMRIAFTIGERVVLPMAGDPLLRDDRRSEPEPEAHGQRREVVQPNTAMRLRAMEEQRYADIRDMAGDDDEERPASTNVPPTPRTLASRTPTCW